VIWIGEAALAAADAGPDLQKDRIINRLSTHRRTGVFAAAVVAPLSACGLSSDAGSAGAGSTTASTGATAGVATMAQLYKGSAPPADRPDAAEEQGGLGGVVRREDPGFT